MQGGLGEYEGQGQEPSAQGNHTEEKFPQGEVHHRLVAGAALGGQALYPSQAKAPRRMGELSDGQYSR